MTNTIPQLSTTLPSLPDGRYYRDFRWALAPLVASAALLFGWQTLLTILIAVAAAVLTDFIIRHLSRPRPSSRHDANVHLAVLLSLTFPPGCWWLVVALAAVLAVIIRQAQGGIGRYLWHPILVARVAVSLFFPHEVWPSHWPILARNHLFTGDICRDQPPPTNLSWFEQLPNASYQAWSTPRPVDQMTDLYHAIRETQSNAEAALLQLLRDRLPPLSDCLLGTTGGGVGETSLVLILLGAAFLVWRGHIPLSLLIGSLAGAALFAAWYPLPYMTAQGSTEFYWPVRLLTAGPPLLPVGLLWVFYHLFGGELCFAVCLIAGDRAICPRRSGMPFLYGMLLGALTSLLRANGYAHGAAYWAILIAGTFTPLLNYTRNRLPVTE